MLLTIGNTIVITQLTAIRMTAIESTAQIHAGRCFPLTDIRCRPFIIGLASSETTTEVSM